MIKIVTDSTAYLPESYVRKHDIRVVPLYVHFGNEAYREGVQMSNEEFYTRLQQAPELPTTSQPSAGEFRETFRELADAGHDILTLTISSKLSGTWDSAMAAKQMLPEARIEVIDTLQTSVPLQMLINLAMEAIDSGASFQEAVDLLESIKAKFYTLFVVDTLEYLAKGGRIGNARAFMGTLLKVKPILLLQDGAIEPCEQVRSKAKAVARVTDLVAEHVGSSASQARLGIIQALVPDEAQALSQQLVERLGCAEPIISSVGPAIGTHTGPGVIGVSAYC